MGPVVGVGYRVADIVGPKVPNIDLFGCFLVDNVAKTNQKTRLEHCSRERLELKKIIGRR